MIIFIFLSHVIACIWVRIGISQYVEIEAGWIWDNEQAGNQYLDFWSIYLTAIYWVIATFTQVGYGDIKGSTDIEYEY